MNPNKTVKRIEKIEKEICGVFDLVLIFGYSGCGLCSKFMGLIFVGQLKVWACVGYCFWVQPPVIFQIFGYVLHVLHVQDLSEEYFNLFGLLFLTYYVLE